MTECECPNVYAEDVTEDDQLNAAISAYNVANFIVYTIKFSLRALNYSISNLELELETEDNGDGSHFRSRPRIFI